LFALGAYVGETVRRGLGGAWDADDEDPNGEINIALHLPNSLIIWPVQRVIKRFQSRPLALPRAQTPGAAGRQPVAASSPTAL
jgi:hypothetical protein